MTSTRCIFLIWTNDWYYITWLSRILSHCLMIYIDDFLCDPCKVCESLERRNCFISVFFSLEKPKYCTDKREEGRRLTSMVWQQPRRRLVLCLPIGPSVSTWNLIGQIRAASFLCRFHFVAIRPSRRKKVVFFFVFKKKNFLGHHHIWRRWICREYSLQCFLQSRPSDFAGNIQFSLTRVFVSRARRSR